MTAVVAYLFEGVPILLADVLLTVQSPSIQPSRDIPSTTSTFRLRVNRTISGTVQKIVVLGKGAVVGFSGSDVVQAARIVSRLRQRLRQPATLEGIDRALSGMSVPQGVAVSLIGWLWREGEQPICFKWTTTNRKATQVDPPIAVGSGAGDIMQFLPDAAQVAGAGLNSPFLRAKAATISGRSRLLSREVDSGSPLAELYYGGAFQAVILEGDTFKFIDDFTMLFWVQNLPSGPPQYRPLAIRYRQLGDRAVFRRLEFNIADEGLVISRDMAFEIPSIDSFVRGDFKPKELREADFGDPFISPIVANAILTRDLDSGSGWHEAAADSNTEDGFVHIGQISETTYGVRAEPAFKRLLQEIRARHCESKFGDEVG